MNIVEAYIKFTGKLIIFVSGIIGCGKTSLAKEISDKFNLKLLDQHDYIKKDYDETIILSDGTEHINWNSDNAIDWDKLNDDINKYKKNGVVVTGMALVDDKITSKPDIHIHLSISKQICISKRRAFIEKNKEQYEDDYKYLNTQTELLKMNKMIYPYYLDAKERSKISKFINANDMTSDQIWDSAWDILIEFFESNIDRVYKKWKQDNTGDDDESVDESDESDESTKLNKKNNESPKNGEIEFIEIEPTILDDE